MTTEETTKEKRKRLRKEEKKRKLSAIELGDNNIPVRSTLIKEKNFSSETVPVAENIGTVATTDQVQRPAEYFEKNEIKISNSEGVDVTKTFIPVQQFHQIHDKVNAHIRNNLKKFKTPTPIQACSWPLLLDGSDIIGVAKTGSGKTMAFGIPALSYFSIEKKESKKKKPRVLVLSPTRELAMQIHEQFVLFANNKESTFLCIYGGVPKRPQQELLKAGVDVIIATPGRLIDLFEEDSELCNLSKVKYLVLDEADRMLDAGFEQAIKKIIAKLPVKRQTVMFSATWPTSIQKMASMYLNNPFKITVGSLELSANSAIKQIVDVLDPNQKETRLVNLLKTYHASRKNRILIFALYKKEAARLDNYLRRLGYKCGAIHGDLSQDQRTRALDAFKDASAPLLIATDVAARGIDIPDVEYVINVTFPLTIEDYCHRIGRTGRAGAVGTSHTFFTLHDKSHSGALINILKQAGQIVPADLMKFGTTVKKKLDPVYGAFVKNVDMSLKPTKMTFADSDDE